MLSPDHRKISFADEIIIERPEQLLLPSSSVLSNQPMTITPTFSTISVTIQPPPEPKKKSRFKKKKNAVGSASNMNSTPFINLVEEPNYESFLVQSLPVDPTAKNKPMDNNNS